MDAVAGSPGHRPALANGGRQRFGFAQRRNAMTLLSFMKEGSLKQHHVAVGAPWSSLEFVEDSVRPTLSAAVDFDRPRPVPERTDSHDAAMAKVHRDLVADMDSDQVPGMSEPLDNELLRLGIEEAAAARLAEADATIPRSERTRMATEIADEVVGYGPLTPLL